MNYKVGDTVICIDTKGVEGRGVPTKLTLGAQYTVREFHRCARVSLKEITGWCSTGDVKGYEHYLPWRFIKLDALKQDQTTEKEVSA